MRTQSIESTPAGMLNRFTIIAPCSLFHALCAAALIILYRIIVYRHIIAIYPGIRLKGFFDYLALSVHYDGITLFFMFLSLLIIACATARWPRLRYTSLALFTIIIIIYFFAAAEFFRIYETTFQLSYAGREHATGAAAMIGSAVAELSARFYLAVVLASSLVIAVSAILLRRERTGYAVLQHGAPGSRDAWVYLALLSFTLIVAILARLLSVPAASIETRYQPEERARYRSLLAEFAMNPMYNLIFTGRVDVPVDTPRSDRERPFRFRLNTDSLELPGRVSRTGSIPRRAGYNIILYFFESTPCKYYRIRAGGTPVVGNWHRLERHALNFRNHYANYPLSANALLSVLTSAYDLDSKDMIIAKYPDIRLKTLPEILSSHGYRTCLIHSGGLGYAGQKRFLKNRKFDEIVDYNDLINRTPYNRQVGWGLDERAMIGRSVAFAKRDRSSPFFLVVMPVNPHHPYAIPGPEFRITGEPPEGLNSKKRSWLNYLNSLYYSDAAMGMMVDAFEREGLMDDTLLFLFADHGEAFYQHRMNYNHPFFLYDENVHVPFLIYNRKLFPTREYHDGISRHIDIAPTILDILGITRPIEQEGISLLAPHRPQMALLHTSWKDDYIGIADGPWKYICRTADRTEELYHRIDDPDETRDLSAARPEVAARYRRFVKDARAYRAEYYRRILSR